MAINWFNGGPPVPAFPSTQSRFHAIVEAMEAEFEASWQSLSTLERQHALTALAQAKQFDVLLSAHVVEPEDALDHKHNSLVASVAQSVLVNSLKVDENSFKRSESERAKRLDEIRAAIEAYRRGRPRSRIETALGVARRSQRTRRERGSRSWPKPSPFTRARHNTGLRRHARQDGTRARTIPKSRRFLERGP